MKSQLGRHRIYRGLGLWCLCWIMCLYSTDVWGGETHRLALRNALQMLIKSNPTLARERLMVRRARSDLKSARGAFSFDLNLDLKLNRSSLPLDVQVDSSVLGTLEGDLALNNLRLEGSLLLNKRFSTGTVASITYLQSWRLQDTPSYADLLQGKKDITTSKTQIASTTFTVQLVQPLLKGAWLPVNLAPIWQALEQVQVVRLQVALAANRSVSEAARAYWELVYSKKELAIKQAGLQLATRQLKSTMALIRAGKKANLERYQVLQAVAARKGDVFVAQDRIVQAESQLRILLKLPLSASIEPIDSPAAGGILDSEKDWVVRALTEHPEIKMAKKKIRMSKWSVLVAKNALLPELNLTGSFSFVGSGRLQTQSNAAPNPSAVSPVGRAYETLFDPRYHRFYIGIQLKIPLDNRKNEGRLQRERAEAQRSILELARLQHRIQVEVRQQYKTLQRTKQRIEIARISETLALKKLEAEQAKLKAGKSTLFQVLTFQQDLSNARLSALRARIDFRKALILLYEKSGILLQKMGIRKM